MVEHLCPHCLSVVRSPDDLAGRKDTCPKCGGKVTVPSAKSLSVAYHQYLLKQQEHREKEFHRQLSWIKDPEAFEILTQLMQHEEWLICTHATEALGRIGGRRAVVPLIEALQQQRLASAAAEALGKLGDARAVQPLIDALTKDPRFDTAAGALGKLGDARAVQPLIDALTKNPRLEAAAEALGRFGDRRAVPALLDAMKEPLRDLFRAEQALGILGDRRAVEPLIQALGWTGWTVQTGELQRWWRIVEALARLADERAIPALSAALLSKDTHAPRDEAARGLRSIGGEKAVGTLLKALGHENQEVRKAASEAVLDIHPHFARCIRGDVDDFARLHRSGYALDADPLIRMLEGFSFVRYDGSGDHEGPARVTEDRRRQHVLAARLLGALGDARAAEPLKAKLISDEPRVRRAASSALARLGQGKWHRWVRGTRRDFFRLGRSHDPEAWLLLVKASETDYVGGRTRHKRRLGPTIVQALARSRDPGAIQAIAGSLLRGYSKEPWEVAKALARIGTDPAIQVLLDWLEGGNSCECAEALGRLGSERAVTVLAEVLQQHPNYPFRHAAITALGRIGGRRAREVLKAIALRNPADEVTRHAATTLRHMRWISLWASTRRLLRITFPRRPPKQ